MIFNFCFKKIKVGLFLITIVTSNSALWADQDMVNEVGKLIENGIDKNKVEIKRLAWILSTEEKTMIIRKYQPDLAIPVFLNVIAGFGTGSYLQGDLFGGVMGTFSGLSAISLFAVPAIFFPYSSNAVYFYLAGGAMTIFYFTFEILRPIHYAALKFKELADVLALNEKTTLFIVPFDRQNRFTRQNDEGAMIVVSRFF